ncbi:MAG: hypothetical protein JWQ52_2525 [Phenylobacterium sp.]|jgi:hypothetical protein|nr:hypothetical protein [Phenylobacterium sp.]
MSPGRLRAALGLAAALAVAGCASLTQTARPRSRPVAAASAPVVAPEARVVIRRVPVRVACVPKTLPTAPTYPDTDAALRASPGAADRYQLMAAGRILRQRRLAELERIIEGCR